MSNIPNSKTNEILVQSNTEQLLVKRDPSQVQSQLNVVGPRKERCTKRGKNLGVERARNTKQVTVEARLVLDHFLSITGEEMSSHHVQHLHPPGDSSSAMGSQEDGENLCRGSQSDVEHQYAVVEDIYHDLLPTPYQAMDSVNMHSFVSNIFVFVCSLYLTVMYMLRICQLTHCQFLELSFIKLNI